MRHILLTALLVVPAMLQAQQIIHGEMLGRPTDTGITIQAFFDADAEARLRYGVEEQQLYDSTAWQACAASSPLEIVLTELKPNQRYYYRLEYRSMIESTVVSRPVRTFHTQRPKGAPFTFVIQADPHMDEQSDTSVYLRTLRNELEDTPDFMIDLGDFLMTDKLKNANHVVPRDTIPYRCHMLRSAYEEACHSVPLFIAIGNHEGETGWYQNGTPNNIAIWGTQERQKYFLNPAPDNFYTGDTTNHAYVGLRENYYAWNWGDALFIVLDPYWYTRPKPDSLTGWRWTLGEDQYLWLKQTLENSTATFKFVFSHQLVGGDPDGRGGVEFANRYEWGGDNLDGSPGFLANRPGWYKPIKDLLTEHRVNIFFHGHDHFFGKQELDCMIYQETPQPSLPNFQNVPQAQDYGYFQGQILPNSGHIRVTVGPTGLQVEYVRAYLPANETPNRHNKDVSATYFIGAINCYDSSATGVPMLWNSNYVDELAFPNPFMEETKINLELDHAEKLNMAIYDGQGKLVRQLIVGSVVPAGKFQVIWDGKTASGVSLPNGTYWYVIDGESIGRRSGKLMLMR